MLDKKASPCVGICMVHGRLNWCLGCGRSLPEIRAWDSLSTDDHASLRVELAARMEIVRTQFGPNANTERS